TYPEVEEARTFLALIICNKEFHIIDNQNDSTFLVFMSHVILDGIVGEHTPDILHDDTIYHISRNYNCSNLKDKPNVIIMQACRR
ncbi:Caspase-12, partial [Galemys pyrenaicus]